MLCCACCAACASSGQPEGLDIYTDHLAASGRFLSLKRYWARSGAPVMDLDYLLEEVMDQVRGRVCVWLRTTQDSCDRRTD